MNFIQKQLPLYFEGLHLQLGTRR